MSVKRWLNNFERETSRRNYLYALNLFVGYRKKNPDVLVREAKADPETMEDCLKEFYHHLKNLGYAAKSRIILYGAVRSFFTWNGVKLGKRPRGFGKGVTYEGRRLLTRTEIARMIDVSSSLRDKAIIAVAAWSGQREGILRALKWGMVREQIEHGNDIVVVRVPAVLLDGDGRNVNKTETEYMFAFGGEAIEYIRKMMEQRKEWGEPITDDSWLFRSYRVHRPGTLNPIPLPKNSKSTPLKPNKLNLVIQRAAEKAGIQKSVKRLKDGKSQHEVHLHAFRRYWKHQMRKAGINDDEFLNFILGHKPPYEGAYDKYTEELIVKLYRQASPYLSLTRTEEEIAKVKEDAAIEALRHLAKTFGIDPMRIRIEREKELGRTPTPSEEIEAIQNEIRKFIVHPVKVKEDTKNLDTNTNNNCKKYESKVVSEDELLPYLDEGWDVVKELSNGKIVIRRPL
ncbi:MAG: tyrosine-type recombinase/integrase [Candidatus Baldrarchaeia archaeon]